ncbi:hypothetical protein T10_13125 [Trichinella papuae]|uniref:Uncharacterized protein n=1 Tax=Trichinella papuae TaxID=268474 RepID=A0A0V1MR98_9BILA|nr:hypothetical protein T10_13125 [Trichinella papuae]
MHKPWLDTLRCRYWPIGFEVVCFRNEPKLYSPWDRVAKPLTSYWSNVANSGYSYYVTADFLVTYKL